MNLSNMSLADHCVQHSRYVSREPPLIIRGEAVGRHACPSQLVTHKTLSRP